MNQARIPVMSVRAAMVAIILASAISEAANDLYTTHMSQSHIGTVADLSMLDSVLAVHLEFFPTPSELGESWKEMDSLATYLDASIIRNAPIIDRWGNPFLIRLAWDSPMILSRGPNGFLDDEEKLDGVLAGMNRWYDSAEYLGRLDDIRGRLDRPAFTADIIVGFPGETAAAFENTLRAAGEAGFARIHVFPFSPRPGTAAADLSGRPRSEEVRERRLRLLDLSLELGRAYRRGLAGLRESVLLEGESGLCGRYQRVRVPGGASRGAAPIPVHLEVSGEDAGLVGIPLLAPTPPAG